MTEDSKKKNILAIHNHEKLLVTNEFTVMQPATLPREPGEVQKQVLRWQWVLEALEFKFRHTFSTETQYNNAQCLAARKVHEKSDLATLSRQKKGSADTSVTCD